MNTKLISITQPLFEVDDKTISPEDLIVYCARVSNPNNQLNFETSPRLISYCIKHGHWSIFEMVDMTVEITTSRAIAAQILRHKAKFQELSQRYSSVQLFEDVELRAQGKTNRQVGDDVIDPELWDGHASEYINDHIANSQKLYNSLLEKGVARECARMILPLCTTTVMYMKNNVRDWIHYINLRTKEDSQKEHRIIAQEIKEIFIANFPSISKALEWA